MNATAVRRVFLACALISTASAWAAPFHFDTGTPDGKIAVASRPSGGFEIESGDDFVTTTPTFLTQASFTGLIPVGVPLSSISQVVVEIYRVFPLDSTFPPSATVPTRVNSPSDVAFASRDSAASELTFSASLLNASFTASNSVQPGGIHPSPNQTTGGGGAVTGQEVRIDVIFSSQIPLPADHYFFVPQVLLSSGNYYWLSAPKPITLGTPFLPDLQSWTRDQFLDPNWLRVGTDIVGGATPPTFNQSFSLDGVPMGFDPSVPTLSPTSLAILGGLLILAAWVTIRRRRST